MAEFDEWAQSIITTYDIPNNDSMVFALATTILHLNASSAYKPKFHFYLLLRKSMSNQVAAGVMQDLKQKQAEKMKAEEEAKANAIQVN